MWQVATLLGGWGALHIVSRQVTGSNFYNKAKCTRVICNNDVIICNVICNVSVLVGGSEYGGPKSTKRCGL